MQKLVIFDCEGVLVDSESISCSVMAQMLRESGVRMVPKEIVRRFSGFKVGDILQHIAQESGITLPDDIEARIEINVADAVAGNVSPVKGVHQALDFITTPMCIASGGSPRKVRGALETVGLLEKFGANIFSTHLVERGKPAPDVFLYAAKSMGFEAQDCVVVEDSPAGVAGARKAGMLTLAYLDPSRAGTPRFREELEQAGADLIFSDMKHLPRLVQ